MQLAMLNEKERLDIFLDIAGIKVYQERKRRVDSNISTTLMNIDNIKKDLKNLDNLIESATEDSKLYEEYNKLSLKKSELEAIITKMELEELNEKIKPISKQLENFSKQTTQNEKLDGIENEMRILKLNLSELKTNVFVCENEKSIEQDKLEQLKIQLDQLRSKSKLIESDKSNRNSSNIENQDSLKIIEKKIKDMEKELSQNKLELDKRVAEDSQKEKELANLMGEMKIYEERIDFFETHKSEKQRKDWWNKKIENLVEEKQSIAMKTSDSKKALEEAKYNKNLAQKQSENYSEIAEKEQLDVKKAKEELGQLNERKISIAEEKLENLNQNFQLKEDIASLNSSIDEYSRNMSGLIGRSTFLGISNVGKIIESLKNKGVNISASYRGIVLENIKFKSNLNVAVETSVRKQLFYHIVDTDRTALRILEELKELNLEGEMNFIALNRVPKKSYNYTENDDYAPLLRYIESDKEINRAIDFIFGDKMLCRDICVVDRSKKFNWVTLDGDQYNKDGSVSGGYLDSSKSKIEMFHKYREALCKLGIKKELLIEQKKLKEESEQKLNAISSSIIKKEKQIQRMIESINNYLKEVRVHESNCANLTQEIILIENNIAEICKEQEICDQKISKMKDMQETSMKHKETDIKFKHSELVQKIIELQKIVQEKKLKRDPLEKKIAEDQIWLNNYLIKQKNSIKENIDELRITDAFNNEQQQSDQLPIEIKRVEGEIKEIQITNDNLTYKIQDFSDKIWTTLKKIKAKTEILQDFEVSRSDQLGDYEKNFAIHTELKTKIENLSTKLEKTAIPHWFDSRTEKRTIDEIYDEISQINEKLKENEHIKYNITEQPSHYMQKKAKIEQDLVQLEKEKESIDKLGETVEREKTNSIYITFKKISYYFTEIFSRLVPEGKGSVVIKSVDKMIGESQNSIPSQTQQQTQAFDSGVELPPIDSIRGIGVKVSFEKGEEVQNIDQLSGGQKSIVALALIFSIQKCEPAPIYLFDEIDAALDEQYRESVGRVIKELSKHSQFICISFMPQLLSYSEKVFEVYLKGKASKCHEISKEEGLKLMTNRNF
ncbi:MAG: Structural maintenance of chromosomes protein 3 [Marteilia pararefringens]